MNNSAVAQFIAGGAIIGLLAWMTTISTDAGNVAVGIVIALWVLWSIKNVSNLQAIAAKIGG